MQITRVSRLNYNHGNTSSFIQMQHTDTIRYNTITSVPIHTSIRYSGESNNYIITVYEGVSGSDITEYDVYNIAVAANYLNQ